MARKSSNEKKDNFKEFEYTGKEFKWTGRVYPGTTKKTEKTDRTLINLTLNGIITIKGCNLVQSDSKSWIAWPSYKDSKNEYQSYVYIPKEANEELDKLCEVIEKALDA